MENVINKGGIQHCKWYHHKMLQGFLLYIWTDFHVQKICSLIEMGKIKIKVP
jgi:hypothetical protein